MQFVTWEALTGQENLLILAPRPGDESRDCGGLIARGCRRGRPPFVVVLTDGAGAADRSAEPDIRAATRLLGLPANRLLLAGLFYDTLPTQGPAFDAIVHGIAMVTWARDCNVICAPWPSAEPDDRHAAHRIAEAVAARTGIGRFFVVSGDTPAVGAPDVAHLDITAEADAKRAALAAYRPHAEPAPFETFISPPARGL